MSSYQHGFTTHIDTVTKIRGWELPDGVKIVAHTLDIPIAGTGMIQKCSVCLDPEAPGDVEHVSQIFLLDSLKMVDDCPIAEYIISSNILSLMRVEKNEYPFPFIRGSAFFTHVPVSPGMVYASEPKMDSEGGLHLWFRCQCMKPIPISVFIRYFSFGT
jgi:hypothetical protein